MANKALAAPLTPACLPLEESHTIVAAGTGPLATEPAAGSEYEIVTLLAPDAIPAIDDPHFYSGDEADAEYGSAELVLGGEAKAYSISLLSRHEIVNDSIGGQPIAVTW